MVIKKKKKKQKDSTMVIKKEKEKKDSTMVRNHFPFFLPLETKLIHFFFFL